MLHIMSDAESNQHEKKMDAWWKSLSADMKMKVYNCFSELSLNVETIESTTPLLLERD